MYQISVEGAEVKFFLQLFLPIGFEFLVYGLKFYFLDYSPDAENVAFTDREFIKIWKIESKDPLKVFEGHTDRVSFEFFFSHENFPK